MRAKVFDLPNWHHFRFDGRRKIFQGINREEFEEATRKRANRAFNRVKADEYRRRREVIRYFAEIPYKYEGDGMDDFNKFQRPASNGRGYVAICPGESGNNYYVSDPLTVAYLKKKYYKNK